MIITLKGADFSGSNIGTLDSWFIQTSITGGGLTAASGNATSIKKNNTTGITLSYTYNTENYKYIIGSGTVTDATGKDVGDVNDNGNGTITVTIIRGDDIGGKITIAISMEYIGVGEEPKPEPETPVNPPSGGTLITSGSLKDSYLIEQSGYISNTYSDGVKTDTAYFIYDLIPVEANTTYRLQYGRAAFFLKSDKSQIGVRVNFTSGYDDWTFTTPSNCAYLSVAFKYSDVATSAVVLENANVGEWVVKSTTLIKDTGAIYADGSGWDSTSYKPKAAEGFYSYAEIPVKASTRYKVENARSTWFLKSDKTAINRINVSNDVTDFIFETPANAAYLSTCWQHAEKNKDEASIVEYEFVTAT